ncbi:hypothetical protein CP556_04325 [Natrinema sp. CBA1119]|uniref:hypothetical protein n=1 Tax=Natrinema sp. CBA1119 TaxID=1608465 RepID=UPI000BF58F27|nr:hypothetical protein [Natrinema sp. CBA1119]PGF15431.1 hypothetical protein CP556_04325 [Natrinema sp. CBA1119]
MEFRDLISTHLPMAVVASVIIALFNIYTGDITTLTPLITEFILHVITIFVAFVIFDAIWYAVFDESVL